jgi:NADPH2:quinone reductase
VRALIIEREGDEPVLRDVPDPIPDPGEVAVEMLAASLNPVDVSIARGGFFAGRPPFPYVPGVEGVGRVSESGASERLIYACFDGLGSSRDGLCGERALVRRNRMIDLPEGTRPAHAAAIGVAGLAGWSPLVRRAPIRDGDVVVVLGATGTVGMVAVQAARLLGAATVVAVGRRPDGLERAVALGADAGVELRDGVDLPAELLAACGGQSPTYVFDVLWGKPAVAALSAAAPGARIVQLGQSAGADALVPSAAIRGKNLDIFGYTNFNLPFEDLATDYLRLLRHVGAGDIVLDIDEVPLEAAEQAWRRQAAGSPKKLVLVNSPQTGG